MLSDNTLALTVSCHPTDEGGDATGNGTVNPDNGTEVTPTPEPAEDWYATGFSYRFENSIPITAATVWKNGIADYLDEGVIIRMCN